jgi:LCP family protein required for cell wall assembly
VIGLVALALVAAGCGGRRHADIVIGKPSGATTTAAGAATIVTVPAPELGRPPTPEPRNAPGLKDATGRPYGTIAFRSDVAVPDELLFVLVAGSDARPNEDVRKTRADSIHLLAVNPRTLEGTILGFPRDAWVEIPGRGANRINMALVYGGPQLLAETVRHLTGLPVHYFVLTGFTGLVSMVDELGGVDVLVERRMNDANSGARFQPGWHHFNGNEALSFSRDRHSTPDGDFTRSLNQGKIILATLAKMRAEVGDDEGLRRWLGVLIRHVSLDVPSDELMSLAALGRRVEPDFLRNVVVPGRVGSAGSQSVVYLGEAAAQIFLDLRPDAVLGSSSRPEQTTTTEPSTTTSSSTTSTTERDGFFG